MVICVLSFVLIDGVCLFGGSDLNFDCLECELMLVVGV